MKIIFLTTFVGIYASNHFTSNQILTNLLASDSLQSCTDFECFNARLEAVRRLMVENEMLKNYFKNLEVENGQLKERTAENEKKLAAVESRTTNLEAKIVGDDFYYKYKPSVWA